MTPRSEIASETLYKPFAYLIREAAATLEPNIYICIIEGYRPPTVQNADFAKGRDSAGHVINRRQVITDARAWQSWHQYRLGADIAPFLVGQSGAINWNEASPQYKTMIAALKNVGLEYGGDWPGQFKDDDHFQMKGLGYSPSHATEAAAIAMMQANPTELDNLDLTKIWASLLPPPVPAAASANGAAT